MAFLEFKILSSDRDEPLNVQVKAGNNLHSGTHETFIHSQNLVKFGRALQAFPNKERSDVTLEVGSREPDRTGYLKLRVFLISPLGKSALEFDHQTNGNPPLQSLGRFYLPAEVATFNRLGAQICGFAESTDLEIRGEWRDA